MTEAHTRPGDRCPYRDGPRERLDLPPALGQPGRVRERRVLAASSLILALPVLAAVTVPGGRNRWVLGLTLLTAVVGGGLRLLSRQLVAVTVRGVSMQPVFYDGDRVLVRRAGMPGVGQVVVVEQPTPNGRWRSPPLPNRAGSARVAGRRWMIKRVVAVPGDPAPALPALPRGADGRVPPGQLVLLGDNSAASLDSRQLGYFPSDRMLGTVRRHLGRSRSSDRTEPVT
ncbi:S26 family signal peptidase [Micromonospora sp. CPCC 205558]|uniref:S26 family signal peptidase n=1 Tax=Micromonospora sp. CPCC 205558 TaxID=3122403 RepID=UPI002FEF9822